MRPVPDLFAKAICANLGYDAVIIYARKEGIDGGESIAYAGSDKRHFLMADEMARFLKQKVFGWTMSPDDPHAQDLPTGQDDIGNRIMMPVLSDKSRKRGK